MTHRPVHTNCMQLPPRSRGQPPPPEQRRERRFDKPRSWAFVFRINAFPDCIRISPANHPCSIYPAVKETHSPCCLAKFANAGLLFVRSAPAVTSTIPQRPALISPEVEISIMWRTFSGTPIGLFGISCIVVVCAELRAAVPQGSKADRDLLRGAHRVPWATIGLLLVVSLLFGIGCRSHESSRGPSIEITQVPHAGASRHSTYLIADYAAVDFVIKYDFWESCWFRISCLGFCLIMAVLFYRCRMFRLTHQLNIRFQERLAERTRIAQELHDTLLQSFQGLMLRFQIATETVLSDPLEAKETLEQALNRADQALAESRKAIQGIRSVASVARDLADSLNAMLNGLVEEFCSSRTPPLTTSVVTEGQPRTVNSWVAEEVCRIAREALLNSLSHARAQRIESEVAYSDRFLRLRFRDDGIGIDSEILKNGGRKGHWGMTGMHERARNIHARLSIWSKPGAGTEVELTIPAYIAYDAAAARGRFRLSKRKEQAHHVEQL
jgi:signal transduction histidine kinase